MAEPDLLFLCRHVPALLPFIAQESAISLHFFRCCSRAFRELVDTTLPCLKATRGLALVAELTRDISSDNGEAIAQEKRAFEALVVEEMRTKVFPETNHLLRVASYCLDGLLSANPWGELVFFPALVRESVKALGFDDILEQHLSKPLLFQNERGIVVPCGKCRAGMSDLGVSSAAPSGWRCDGSTIFPGGCLKGCTGFHQTRGWYRFRCDSCDFDFCVMCANHVAVLHPSTAEDADADAAADAAAAPQELEKIRFQHARLAELVASRYHRRSHRLHDLEVEFRRIRESVAEQIDPEDAAANTAEASDEKPSFRYSESPHSRALLRRCVIAIADSTHESDRFGTRRLFETRDPKLIARVCKRSSPNMRMGESLLDAVTTPRLRSSTYRGIPASISWLSWDSPSQSAVSLQMLAWALRFESILWILSLFTHVLHSLDIDTLNVLLTDSVEIPSAMLLAPADPAVGFDPTTTTVRLRDLFVMALQHKQPRYLRGGLPTRRHRSPGKIFATWLKKSTPSPQRDQLVEMWVDRKMPIFSADIIVLCNTPSIGDDIILRGLECAALPTVELLFGMRNSHSRNGLNHRTALTIKSALPAASRTKILDNCVKHRRHALIPKLTSLFNPSLNTQYYAFPESLDKRLRTEPGFDEFALKAQATDFGRPRGPFASSIISATASAKRKSILLNRVKPLEMACWNLDAASVRALLEAGAVMLDDFHANPVVACASTTNLANYELIESVQGVDDLISYIRQAIALVTEDPSFRTTFGFSKLQLDQKTQPSELLAEVCVVLDQHRGPPVVSHTAPFNTWEEALQQDSWGNNRLAHYARLGEADECSRLLQMASEQAPEMVFRLLESKNRHGQTALVHALWDPLCFGRASNEEEALTVVEVATGARVLRDRQGELAAETNSCPIFAGERRDRCRNLSNTIAVLDCLLKFGADATATCRTGFTPLMWAVAGGWFVNPETGKIDVSLRIPLVTRLLSHDASVVNCKSNFGTTALLLALHSGSHDAVRTLLAAGADPFLCADVVGAAPLFYAASRQRPCVESCSMLVAAHCQQQGRCAAQLALECTGLSGVTALGLLIEAAGSRFVCSLRTRMSVEFDMYCDESKPRREFKNQAISLITECGASLCSTNGNALIFALSHSASREICTAIVNSPSFNFRLTRQNLDFVFYALRCALNFARNDISSETSQGHRYPGERQSNQIRLLCFNDWFSLEECSRLTFADARAALDHLDQFGSKFAYSLLDPLLSAVEDDDDEVLPCAIRWACITGLSILLRKLCERKSFRHEHLNSPSRTGLVPAALVTTDSVLEVLVDLKADLQHLDADGTSPLAHAVTRSWSRGEFSPYDEAEDRDDACHSVDLPELMASYGASFHIKRSADPLLTLLRVADPDSKLLLAAGASLEQGPRRFVVPHQQTGHNRLNEDDYESGDTLLHKLAASSGDCRIMLANLEVLIRSPDSFARLSPLLPNFYGKTAYDLLHSFRGGAASAALLQRLFSRIELAHSTALGRQNHSDTITSALTAYFHRPLGDELSLFSKQTPLPSSRSRRVIGAYGGSSPAVAAATSAAAPAVGFRGPLTADLTPWAHGDIDVSSDPDADVDTQALEDEVETLQRQLKAAECRLHSARLARFVGVLRQYDSGKLPVASEVRALFDDPLELSDSSLREVLSDIDWNVRQIHSLYRFWIDNGLPKNHYTSGVSIQPPGLQELSKFLNSYKRSSLPRLRPRDPVRVSLVYQVLTGQGGDNTQQLLMRGSLRRSILHSASSSAEQETNPVTIAAYVLAIIRANIGEADFFSKI